MMGSLKEKTITGLTWSFTDNFFNIGMQFVIGIILARLLTPKEFGLIGMTTIFITLSQLFIDGCFSLSLIQKQKCTQDDYSTVFYFNLIAGILAYLLLFFLAEPISIFFNEPKLIYIIRVIGIGLIFNSFTIVQQAILTKRIDFKLQAKISVISTGCSGIAAIYMAYLGFGVWSLVWKTIGAYCLITILSWSWIRWRPVWVFNYGIFKSHFKFSYKLLLSNLINVMYTNIYYIIIGKFFNAVELGYYTRAEQFSNLPSLNITAVVHRVSYPVLSQLQNDEQKLKYGYKKLIRSTMFISFILMIGLAVMARPLILTLIGEKWKASIIYLQLLCFSAMLYPLHALNLNILNVKGRSDLFLRLEIIKKLLVIPVILVAVSFGVKAMLVSLIIISIGAYFLNSYWSGKMVNYSMREQILDITPSLFLAIFTGAIVFFFGWFVELKPLYLLIVQMFLFLIITIGFSELFKLDAYLDIKEIILFRLLKLR